MEADVGLARLAQQQCGMFHVDQVSAAGIGDATRRRRVRSGLWVEEQPRVLRHASTVLDWQGKLRAACLSSPRFVVSHRAAAALLGLEPFGEQILEGTLRGGGAPRLDAVIHRTHDLLASEVVEEDGLRRTTGARTVLDLCCVVDHFERVNLVDIAVCARATTAASVHRGALRLRPGRPHLIEVARVTAPGAAAAFRSWLERRSKTVYAAGAVPEPERNVVLRDDGRFLGLVDCVWRDARLVVELDGLRFHSSPERRRADQARQNRLTIAGWRVLRFTWRDIVEEPDRVAAEILHALG